MTFINEYFDRVFVINLDSRPDRMKDVATTLKSRCIEYERFPGIKLGEHKMIDPGLYNLCHLTPHANNPKYHLGMVGCKLSHLSIVKMSKERGYRRILILEDDIIVSPNVDTIFKKAVTQEPGWDMFYLGGTFLHPNEKIPGKDSVSRAKGVFTTSSYALDNSRGIFDYIENNLGTYGGEIDVFYAYNIHTSVPSKWSAGVPNGSHFKAFVTVPCAISQNKSKSDIVPLKQVVPTAFNRDPIIEKEMKRIVSRFDINCVIETGTWKAISTRFFATIVPEVHSIEIVEAMHLEGLKNTRDFQNILLYCGSSNNVLGDLLPTLSHKKILFYLDAHWQNYWPLLDEIRIIGSVIPDKAIIVIDDFQVPHRDFQYDSYHNQANNLSYIKDALTEAYPKGYTYYYNNTTQRPLRGVGKIYIFPESFQMQDFFIEENGEPYSTF